jgi:hypothetical protein
MNIQRKIHTGGRELTLEGIYDEIQYEEIKNYCEKRRKNKSKRYYLLKFRINNALWLPEVKYALYLER